MVGYGTKEPFWYGSTHREQGCDFVRLAACDHHLVATRDMTLHSETGDPAPPMGGANRVRDERVERIEHLVSVLATLNADLDLEASLGRVARAASGMAGAVAAGIVLIEDGTARVGATHGLPPTMLGHRYQPGRGVVAEVVRTGRPVVVHDLTDAPAELGLPFASVEGIRTAVVLPLLARGSLLGTLHVLFPGTPTGVDESTMEVLGLLAGSAAAAVANAAAHEALLASRRHERDVVDALPDGVAVAGPDGLVRSWNASAATATGLSAEDAVGHPVPFPVGAPGLPLEHRTADGRMLQVVATSLPRTGETVLVVRDVTAAREVDEAKRLFLAMSSHDVKTPLAVIKGFADTLIERWEELPERVRVEALNAISRRSDDLIDRVDRLLTGFRADAGWLVVKRVPFAVIPIVERAARSAAVLSTDHPVVLAEIDADIFDQQVIGDPISLEEGLTQLVENAVKYSPTGGSITLSVSRHEDHDGTPWIAVEVADRGAGVPGTAVEQIFERYYRAASPGDLDGAGGAGLGLYIVRTQVEAMGGKVSARRREGGGSVFTVLLPPTA